MLSITKHRTEPLVKVVNFTCYCGCEYKTDEYVLHRDAVANFYAERYCPECKSKNREFLYKGC